MRVRTRLILLLLLLSAIFTAGRYFYQIFEDKRVYALFKDNNEEKNIYFDKLVKLKGSTLETLAFDYTYWDEMVDFILNNDIEWAKKMLNETVLKTYQADTIWVYKRDLSQAYFINNQDSSVIKEFPLPREAINNIFLKERFCHFFVDTSAGLMEIRGATIHPSSDPTRKTAPCGYFFTGRLWNKNYIEELSKLVGGQISISAIKQAIPDFKTLSERNTIILSREFSDWQGKPAAYIYVNIQSKEMESYKLFSRNAAIIFIGFIISVIIFIAVFLTILLSTPFFMISQTLKTEDPENLRGLKKDTSEFGDIARLISKFFEQKEILVKEISERKKAEGELKESYTKLKEIQDQLIQAEKLNAIGQLASGVAHEVRNPLGIMLQGVNYLESRLSSKEVDILETLAALKDNIGRADSIVNSLLDFSKDVSLGLNPEDINPILQNSLALVKTRLKFENIDTTMEIKKGMPKVLADKNKLEQVFINILLNAAQAMPDGGKIAIRSFDKQLETIKNGIGRRVQDNFQLGEKVVMVEIEDTGTGITEENLKRIFDPFFTTKGQQGTGLGLSVTKSIIHMHRGLIYADSKPGQGTIMTVILKVAER
ncbi:MAG: ATP-binding protein [Candidatus Omnitrophota bacterium]